MTIFKKGPLARLAYELGETEFDYSNWNVCHGGKGGGSSGGGGTNTTNTITNSTPPPEIMAAYQQALSSAQTASSAPLQQYPGQTVAGFTPAQLQAFGTINQAQGAAQPFIQGSANLINQGTQPLWNNVQQFSPSAVNQYMSPYTGQVLNAAVAQQKNTDDQQQAALQGNTIRSGAWGGDRAGVASAILSGQQDLANNTTNANILNTGYTTGLGEFNTQQQAQLGANEANSYLNQQGAFGLANLGNEALGTQLQGASSQLQSGALQQQLAQEQLNVPYQQFLQQQAYPFQTAQYYANIAEGLGSASGGTGTGTTTSPAPSTTSQVAGLGLGGLGIIGGTGGFGSGGWLSSLFANRGGRIQPYRRGGGVPHYAEGGIATDIPNLSISYIPSTSGAHGRGPPEIQPPKTPLETGTGQPSAADLGNIVKLINSVKGAGASSTSGAGSLGGLGSSASSIWGGGSSFGDTASAAASAQSANDFIGPTSDQGFGSFSAGWSNGGRATQKRAVGGQVLPDILSAAGDIAGLFFGDPSAGEKGVKLLSVLDGGETGGEGIQGRAFGSLKGNEQTGFDDGGTVGGMTPISASSAASNPLQQSKNTGYQGMTQQQLQELIMRLPAGSPQSSAVSAVLQQKRMLPNVGAQAAGGFGTQQPQAGMACGGALHFDDGGDVPDQDERELDLQNEVSQEPSVPAPAGGLGSRQMTASASPPTGAEPAKPTHREANPWLALANAGFAIAGGTSPQAGVNIGRGAMQGLSSYAQQQKEVDTVNESADKLWQEAKQHRDQIAIEQENADTNKQYKDLMAHQGHIKIVPDGLGGFIQYDERNPGSVKTIAGAGLANDPKSPLAGLSGKSFLDELGKKDPSMAAQVKAMDEGDLLFPSGFAAKAPYWQQRLNALYQYNPNASQQTAAAYKQFMSGPLGNTTRSLNVATNHIELANQLIDAMHNGDTKQVNALGNRLQTELGLSAAPTNLDAVKQVMSGEIVKASTGTGGALGDRDSISNTINNANSPELLKGALKTYQGLMGGQFRGLKKQYEQQTSRKDYDRFLEPEALNAMGVAPGAVGPSPGDVAYLKSNPAVAAKFDARFGNGASQKYLGQ